MHRMKQGLNAAIDITDRLGNVDFDIPEMQKRALYSLFKSKDTRFDGQVYVGVSSTGIYCRTVCSANMPKYENCTFYKTAAEAELAGYRPCLICRPEIAPGHANSDASTNLAQRAALLLRENCTSSESLEHLASRLGYTDRHLRRAFQQQFNVTPVQYLQTCRLLLAKSLLTDSGLPVNQVAHAAGFKSVRRFNDLFKERYRLTPTTLRRNAKANSLTDEGISFRLSYRPPYRFDELLAFFKARALQGVELVDNVSYKRVVRMLSGEGNEILGWIEVTNDSKRNALKVTLSESLLPVTSQVIDRVRRQFDVNCDPHAVFEGIKTLNDVQADVALLGTRLPGCFDPFETSTRAILGQQVSVAAANKLASRIVEKFGKPVDTGIEGLTHAFPNTSEVTALGAIEDELGSLGVIKTRSRTIAAIAQQLVQGELNFGTGAIVSEQIERLLAIKGIGPWSANYIVMRVFSYPDAFLETDVGVKHALPDYTPKERLTLAGKWRPWRSYVTISLWNSLTKEERG